MKKEPRAMGNYLGKQRRNFYITNRCWRLMHEMAMELGVNHSNLIELAIRRMYPEITGKSAAPVPEGGVYKSDF